MNDPFSHRKVGPLKNYYTTHALTVSLPKFQKKDLTNRNQHSTKDFFWRASDIFQMLVTNLSRNENSQRAPSHGGHHFPQDQKKTLIASHNSLFDVWQGGVRARKWGGGGRGGGGGESRETKS